jgi:hypothetical protein
MGTTLITIWLASFVTAHCYQQDKYISDRIFIAACAASTMTGLYWLVASLGNWINML